VTTFGIFAIYAHKKNNFYKGFAVKHKSKGLCAKHRHNWEENIEKYTKKFGVITWTVLM